MSKMLAANSSQAPEKTQKLPGAPRRSNRLRQAERSEEFTDHERRSAGNQKPEETQQDEICHGHNPQPEIDPLPCPYVPPDTMKKVAATQRPKSQTWRLLFFAVGALGKNLCGERYTCISTFFPYHLPPWSDRASLSTRLSEVAFGHIPHLYKYAQQENAFGRKFFNAANRTFVTAGEHRVPPSGQCVRATRHFERPLSLLPSTQPGRPVVLNSRVVLHSFFCTGVIGMKLRLVVLLLQSGGRGVYYRRAAVRRALRPSGVDDLFRVSRGTRSASCSRRWQFVSPTRMSSQGLLKEINREKHGSTWCLRAGAKPSHLTGPKTSLPSLPWVVARRQIPGIPLERSEGKTRFSY